MKYIKTINGRQIFSDCRTIQTNEGLWISNPSEQQILDAGWQVYVPPLVVLIPQTEPDYLQVMNAVKKMLSSSVENLSDEEALEVAALYPTWNSKIGKQVNTGERFWYDGKLYKVLQLHTVLENWPPNESVSLYTEISIEEWPEWIQPTGAQDSYMIGDQVTFQEQHYVSTMDYNVYQPDVYGWEQQ